MLAVRRCAQVLLDRKVPALRYCFDLANKAVSASQQSIADGFHSFANWQRGRNYLVGWVLLQNFGQDESAHDQARKIDEQKSVLSV